MGNICSSPMPRHPKKKVLSLLVPAKVKNFLSLNSAHNILLDLSAYIVGHQHVTKHLMTFPDHIVKYAHDGPT